MKQAEARVIVWRRLAITARADVHNADWMFDEAPDPADRRKLERACAQVAESIERRLDEPIRTRPKRRPAVVCLACGRSDWVEAVDNHGERTIGCAHCRIGARP